MDWPVRFPAEMSAGPVSVRPYICADAAELFTALDDERAWEHIPRAVPVDAASLDESIQSKLADGTRLTFTVRQGSRVVGMTSVIFDPADPAGAEVGGTQYDPAVWGTGVDVSEKRTTRSLTYSPGFRELVAGKRQRVSVRARISMDARRGDAAANFAPQPTQFGLQRIKLRPGNAHHLYRFGTHPFPSILVPLRTRAFAASLAGRPSACTRPASPSRK